MQCGCNAVNCEDLGTLVPVTIWEKLMVVCEEESTHLE